MAKALITIALLAASTIGAAQDGPPESGGLRVAVGAGVISAPRPYVGASNQIRAIPLVELTAGRFSLQGIRAGYRLVDGDGVDLDLRVRARFGGLDPDDSPALAGMAPRRGTAEAGLALDLDLGGSWGLQLGAFGDVLGRHGGWETAADLGWRQIWGRGRAGVVPSVGVVWQSAELVDYYAGVRPSEARPGRPAFAGRAALNLEAGLLGFWRVGGPWRVTTLVRLQRLANELEDSPIIDRQWGWFGLAGLTYEF